MNAFRTAGELTSVVGASRFQVCRVVGGWCPRDTTPNEKKQHSVRVCCPYLQNNLTPNNFVECCFLCFSSFICFQVLHVFEVLHVFQVLHVFKFYMFFFFFFQVSPTHNFTYKLLFCESIIRLCMIPTQNMAANLMFDAFICIGPFFFFFRKWSLCMSRQVWATAGSSTPL